MPEAKQLQRTQDGRQFEQSTKTRQYVLNNRRLLHGLRTRNRSPEREEADVL